MKVPFLGSYEQRNVSIIKIFFGLQTSYHYLIKYLWTLIGVESDKAENPSLVPKLYEGNMPIKTELQTLSNISDTIWEVVNM